MVVLRLKKDKKKKRESFPVRLNEDEKAAILRKAKVFTEGKIGEFMRYAALNFNPRKKDLEKD